MSNRKEVLWDNHNVIFTKIVNCVVDIDLTVSEVLFFYITNFKRPVAIFYLIKLMQIYKPS